MLSLNKAVILEEAGSQLHLPGVFHRLTIHQHPIAGMDTLVREMPSKESSSLTWHEEVVGMDGDDASDISVYSGDKDHVLHQRQS